MRIKFYTVSILVLFLCVNFACAQEFYQPKKSYAEERDSYVKTFDKFSPSEIQTPFTSGFSGQIPLNKQDLTPEEKEKEAKDRRYLKEFPEIKEEQLLDVETPDGTSLLDSLTWEIEMNERLNKILKEKEKLVNKYVKRRKQRIAKIV